MGGWKVGWVDEGRTCLVSGSARGSSVPVRGLRVVAVVCGVVWVGEWGGWVGGCFTQDLMVRRWKGWKERAKDTSSTRRLANRCPAHLGRGACVPAGASSVAWVGCVTKVEEKKVGGMTGAHR